MLLGGESVEKLEKRIKEQGKIAEAKIEKERAALKERVKKEDELKAAKLKERVSAETVEEKRKREFFHPKKEGELK